MRRLWRWFRYIVLTITILATASLVFLINSNWTVQSLAERYAPQYTLGYKRLTGTVLEGIELEGITFENSLLANKLTLRWDLFSLLKAELKLHTLDIQGLQSHNLQTLLEKLSLNESDPSNKPPFSLHIEKVYISMVPFEQSGIGFREILLKGQDLVYDRKYINLSKFLLNVDSNVTTLQLEGNLHHKKIRVTKLDIRDIDTEAFPNIVKNLIAINFPQEIVRHVEPEIEDYKARRKHLLPSSVQIDTAQIRLKPANYPQISIKQGVWTVNSLFVDVYGIIDLKKHSIQYGNSTLHLDTNLSTLSMASQWKEDTLTVESLSLRDVDTKIWQSLLNKMQKNSSGGKKRFNAEIPWESDLPYLPKVLLLKYFEGSVNSAVYGSFELASAEMNASQVLFNLPDLRAEKGEIDLSVISNYGNLRQHTVLKERTIESTGTIESASVEDLSFAYRLKDRNASFQYDGSIKAGSIKGPDGSISRFLHDLDIKFEGDTKGVELCMESNESQLHARYLFAEADQIQLKVFLPKSAAIRTLLPGLNIDAFSPMDANLSFKDKKLHMDIHTKDLVADLEMNTVNQDLHGKIMLDDALLSLKGNLNKVLTLQHSTDSLKHFLTKLNSLYTFAVPPLDGDAEIVLSHDAKSGLNLQLSSKNLRYAEGLGAIYPLSDTKLALRYSEGNFTLERYTTQYKQERYYANRPSRISLKGEVLTFDPFWLNDTLKITGNYDMQSKNGALTALADAVTFPLDTSELTARVNVKTEMHAGAANVQGEVNIIGGNIDYDIHLKTFATDRDIIDVGKEKKKKRSPFIEKLTALVKVHTDKTFHYHSEAADILAKADLLIQKEQKGPFSLFGNIEIKKDSSYRIKKKKLVFKQSYLSFAGEMNNPYLDITLLYKTQETKISIQIKGELSDPVLIFHSTPYMNKRQILSTILFDTQDEIPNMDEEKMVHMMNKSLGPSLFSNVGGAVVKSVFSNVGINVDNIPFIGASQEANTSKKKITGLFSFEEKKERPSHFIHFSGQKEITEKALQKAMGVNTKPFWKFWSTARPHIDDRLLPTLKQSLNNFYDSEGFYDAKISLRTTANDVYVHIEENRPVRVKGVKVSSDHDIAKIFTFKKGQRFRSETFVALKREIANTLLQEGYCSYDMDAKAYVDLERHEADLYLNLKKGGVCTFGKVNIKKFDHIDDSIILSRLRAREGERFHKDLIEKSYDALYGLEAFDSIHINHDRKFYNVIPLKVEGKEISRPWFVKGDVDYDTEVGFRLNAEVLRTNFMGNAKSIRLALTYSKIEKGVELSYFIPALFRFSNYYIDLTNKIGYRDFTYTGFIEKKKYAKSYLSYSDEKWQIHAGLAAEDIEISPRGTAYDPNIVTGDFSTFYPFLHFQYDSRIFNIRPKSGYYLGADLEYALPYSQEASAYLKYVLEGSATFSLGNFTFSTVAKAGILDQQEYEIPESKRFFAGGYHSNRAYGYQRVGVTTSETSFSSEGASSMANLTLEASYALNDYLYGLLFTDNTMLNKEAYDFNGNILSSLGLGLFYVTPIAPIRIDIGMNIHDSSQYAIHFQLGESF